ncbi:MAG: Ku protein [Acidobacteria bacterium]|nr:MAG: Ku protein [Acidobacteriota bacterium]
MAATIWKGQLQFGLVSLPIRLYSAARGESVSFNLLHAPDHSRIRQVIYCQAEDKPVPRNELVKGYEYEKDHYVVIDDEDIQKAAPKTAKVMEIQEFVKADQVDPLFLESSYYVAPEEGGEKPYALLFEALRQSQFYAVAKVSMHNREHVVILRPASKGLLLHTMYYVDEIRRGEEFRTDVSLVKERELELAKTLISSLAEDFQPEKYHDTYRENLREMIDAKVSGRKIVEPPPPKIAPVIDIMEALKQSISARRKPVQSVTAEPGASTEVKKELASRKRGRRKAS